MLVDERMTAVLLGPVEGMWGKGSLSQTHIVVLECGAAYTTCDACATSHAAPWLHECNVLI